MNKKITNLNAKSFINLFVCLLLLVNTSWANKLDKHSERLEARTITGLVVDANGLGLPGVSVLLKGTDKGTVTSIEGKFSILSTSDKDVLVFSFLGFKTIERVVGNQSNIKVTMQEDTELLDEVVVTAMSQERKKESLTYAQQGVNAEELSQVTEPNFMNLLAGKVAGLQISGSGDPNGTVNMVLRGYASLTGDNAPLIVIDGVPVDNSADQLDTSGGMDFGNNASNIDPNNVKDIQVLPGANAAALYGARASNGAIVITTKKGSASGKFEVSLNSSVSTQVIMEYPRLQNVYGGGAQGRLSGEVNGYPDSENAVMNWGTVMDGFEYIDVKGDIDNYERQPNNVKDFFGNALFLKNTLTMMKSFGNKSINFSYSNNYNNSVVDNMDIKNAHNFNLRFNMAKASGFNVDSRISYNTSSIKNRTFQNGNSRNPYFFWTQMPRNTKLSDLQEGYINADGTEMRTASNSFANPYWVMNKNPNLIQNHSIRGFVNVGYDINDDLSVSAQFSGDTQTGDIWRSKSIGDRYDYHGLYEEMYRMNNEINIDAKVNYKKELNDDISFSLLGGGNISMASQVREHQQADSLETVGVYSFLSTEKPRIVRYDTFASEVYSVYGLLTSSYKDFLYLDVTARNDWSSTLPVENRSFFYPSFGLSVVWNKLIDMPESIGRFKTRLNWAKVGNDGRNNRQVLIQNQFYLEEGVYNGQPTATEGLVKVNENLKPEITYSWELGLETALFNDFLDLNATLYSSRSENQIVFADAPPTSGYGDLLLNAGVIENEGIEISGTFNWFKKGKFRWNTSVNYSKNNSLVVDITGNSDRIVLRNANGVALYAEEGKPFGVLRGNDWAVNELGQRIVQGPNESTPGAPVIDENAELGNITPDWMGSIQNRITYKGFTLNVFIDAKFGGDLKSFSMHRANRTGVTEETLEARDEYYKNRYALGENDTNGELSAGLTRDAVYRVFDSEGNVTGYAPSNFKYDPEDMYKDYMNNIHSETVYDASYVKLRQVTLSYSFPKKMIEKLHLQTLRIGVFGKNIAMLYDNMPEGFDPESVLSGLNGQGFEYGSQFYSATFGGNLFIKF